MNKIKKNKNYLFVDGTNLYAGQYELYGPKKYLDFSLLIKDLDVKLKIKFDKIYFYASYSPLPKKPLKKEKEYLKNEAMFYKSVKKTKNVEFFTGYRSKTSGKEKEVDVKLTADIITYAFLDRYDSAYLFTGDADFLQALFSIKKFHNKKKINIISLQNKVLFRGAFFFKTYILILNQILLNKLKFRDFQKHEFIYVSSEVIIKDV
jgi:uncharacterized LabA/DUF88 family protein